MPFVLEQYDPAGVVLLERGSDGVVAGRKIKIAGIKAKTYKGNLRRVLAEAMLGEAVLCVEGVSDAEAIYAASAVLESGSPEGSYTPLDLSGVTVVHCEGDGALPRYGEFFSELGLKTYAFYDRQKNAAISAEIGNAFDVVWELGQSGVEYLLADETGIPVVREFLSETSKSEDYPHDSHNPERFAYDPTGSDDEVRRLCRRVLMSRKGAGYAKRLVELSSPTDLPSVIINALTRISSDLPNDLRNDDSDQQEHN